MNNCAVKSRTSYIEIGQDELLEENRRGHSVMRAIAHVRSELLSHFLRRGATVRNAYCNFVESSGRRVMESSNFRRVRRDTEWRSWKKTSQRRGKRQRDRVYLARDLQLPPMIGPHSILQSAVASNRQPLQIRARACALSSINISNLVERSTECRKMNWRRGSVT